MPNIVMPESYREIFETDKHYCWIDGGRVGGKTRNTAQTAIITMLQNPYTDVIVARVSYGSLADSSYAEFISIIQELGLEDEFRFKKSPLRIERRNNAGTIYFIGYGGSNTSRTKSIKTKHKISIVILEETQELKEVRSFDEALASFRRHFGKEIKVLVLGNPPPQEAHWFNKERYKKLHDPDWLVKRVTWEDIVPFINDFDLKEILKTQANDLDYYKWFYMGESYTGATSVYPMFRKDKHIISAQDLAYVFESTSIRPVGIVIGGDGAVTRDATAFVPLVLLSNGQVIVAPIFYHNPKEDGVIGYHTLVQNNLTRWFDDICKMFHAGTRQELIEHPNMKYLPIWMRIDSAAPDLIQECKFFFGNRVNVGAIQKHSIMEMVGICQSAIANNNVVIVDYGWYYDYQLNKQVKTDMNLLAEQLSLLTWNDQQTNYDPIVPNDIADGFTYGTLFWFSNQENIQFFNLVKLNGAKLDTISDIMRKRG